MKLASYRLSWIITVGICLQGLSLPGFAGSGEPSATAKGDSDFADAASADAKPTRDLQTQEPQLDTYEPATAPLRMPKGPNGEAAALSGNVVERQLAIDWDTWRNTFRRAVNSGLFPNPFEAINTKRGTYTFYHCEVTADRHIKNLKILRSSGDFWFDNRVVKAVNNLDGSSILAFPSRSTRTEISADIGIVYGGRRAGGDLYFDDVEYRQLAPDEKLEESPEDKARTLRKRRRTKADSDEATRPAN